MDECDDNTMLEENVNAKMKVKVEAEDQMDKDRFATLVKSHCTR